MESPVYIAGSSAAAPFIAKVAAELIQQSPKITVVYFSSGSCDGVNYFAGSTRGKLSGVGKIYDAAGKEIAGGCNLKDNTVDVGVSDVYSGSCGVSSLAEGVKDFSGPIQAMTFAVPSSSTATIISAEAAYLVYGFGNASQADSWTDETAIQQRSATSGTQQMISAYIKLPAAKFKGVSNSSSGNLLTSLTASATAGNADKSIGILATDVADKNRGTVRVLGYQHYGQSCAYWPDSTVNGFDKANVRDGHYPIWGPMHLLAETKDGQISNENARKLVNYLSGAETPSSFDLIAVEAMGGVVPGCAMHVKRSSDGGELSSFQPDKACGCKFVKEATGDAPSECKTCSSNSDCSGGTPVCNYGFCEVK